jgi:hypothetical protein
VIGSLDYAYRRVGPGTHSKQYEREGIVPKSVLTRGRKIVARLTALAMVASIMVIGALPASAEIDTSATCPSSTPSAGFTDIAGQPAHTQLAINCIADYGIAQGFTATTFVPQAEVSRWQMALFLTRQATVHGLTLGDGSSQGFTDIADYPAATQTAINQLAQLEITQGTTATTYSPAAPVTRWQMALFLTRLLDAAGYTLGNGSPQGFADIGAYPASTQVAINQIAQAEVSEGFTATTFGPGQNTLRSQMALFLTRTLAADGILPAGQGFVVTAFNLTTDVITYDDAGTSRTVDYTGGTAFTVDGAAASIGVFEANLSVGDKIAFTGTTFALTNVSVSSGLVNDVNIAGNTFDIILSSGPILTDNRTYVAANTTYTVNGAVASEVGFENNLSNGDTIAISGAGTVASPYVFALTNATVTGTVSGVGGATTWNVTTAGGAVFGVIDLDVPAGDTLSLSVGGAAATQATFETALSNGDAVTYGRAATVVTASLTNQATAAQTGRILSFDTGANTVTFDAGPATAVTTADYTATGTVRTVNGTSQLELEFEAALNVGDTITYQAGSTTPLVNASLAVTNVTPITGTPSSIDAGLDTISIRFDANGPGSVSISYADADDPNIVNSGLAGNLTLAYQVNGVASTVGNFEAAVTGIIGGLSGSVTVSDSGTVTIWNVTSP